MQNPESPDNVTVSGLFSYPVKGCRAIAHTTASVLTTGLSHDREWMVVDARSSPAQFITQRQCPAMAILKVETKLDGGLKLSTDDGDALRVGAPLRNSLIKVKVWGHETIAFDLGDDAAKWLQRKLVLNHAVRLVKFNRDLRRDCSRLYAEESGAHTYFADGYPMLLTNAASLADLNSRIDGGSTSAIPMNLFRPNLVVNGLPAWDEEHTCAVPEQRGVWRRDVWLECRGADARAYVARRSDRLGIPLLADPLCARPYGRARR